MDGNTCRSHLPKQTADLVSSQKSGNRSLTVDKEMHSRRKGYFLLRGFVQVRVFTVTGNNKEGCQVELSFR